MLIHPAIWPQQIWTENWETVPLWEKERKGKEEYLYSAFLAKVVHSKRSGMDHTVLLANNTMPATEAADIQLQLATHLSTLKG